MVNWSVLLRKPRQVAAVQNFVQGSGVRNILGVVETDAQRTEVYRLERMGVRRGRQAAARALRSRQA